MLETHQLKLGQPPRSPAQFRFPGAFGIVFDFPRLCRRRGGIARSLPPGIGRCRQKCRPGLWPRTTGTATKKLNATTLNILLAKLFANSAYAGSIFHTALTKVLPNLGTEIVKRSDRAKGFVPLPKRWIVERTIAWLNRCRRLAKDWENLNRNALAFLKLASIRLMLRKLCNP
jgi:transposase